MKQQRQQRRAGHGADRAREDRQAAGDAAIGERRRAHHDVHIGGLEQADAQPLHRQGQHHHRGRDIGCPQADQKQPAADRREARARRPARRRRARSASRPAARSSAIVAEPVASTAPASGNGITAEPGEEIGHEQQHRERRQIHQHGNEIDRGEARRRGTSRCARSGERRAPPTRRRAPGSRPPPCQQRHGLDAADARRRR